MLCPSTYKRGASTSEEEAMLTELLIYAWNRGFAVGKNTLKSLMSHFASDEGPGWKDGVPSEDKIRAFGARHREITFKMPRKRTHRNLGKKASMTLKGSSKCWKTSRKVILGFYPTASECEIWMKPVYRVNLEKEPKDWLFTNSSWWVHCIIFGLHRISTQDIRKYSIPPLIEYRPWTGFVFNSGNMQYAGAYHTVSYSKKVATCTGFILWSHGTTYSCEVPTFFEI